MSTDDDYVCCLCEASLEKAKKELNEDPKERLSSVQTLRNWINQEQWISAPTETLYLLAVLRTKKFSQLNSRELIEIYWKVRTKYPDWYKGIQPCTEEHFSLLRKSCTYLVLPKKDKEGRTLILGRLSQIDSSGKSYGPDEWVRSQIPIFESMLIDEESQVNGYVMLVDCTGISVQLQTFFGLERSMRSKDTNKALMGRIKQIHYYNVGPIFEAMFAISRPFLSKKLESRITMHGNNLVSVYKHIDMSLLPDEYLPDDYKGPRIGPCQQIIENFIETRLKDPKVKAFLHDYYNGPYGVDLSKKPKDDVPQASFRKLNVS